MIIIQSAQDNYLKKKQTLLKALDVVKNVSLSLNSYDKIKEIEKTESALNAEMFRLAIVGEFSRGKSTLINALLGRKLLPSTSSPTTTVISKIIYGGTPEFRIVYKDGHEEKLREENFKELKSPKEVDKTEQKERWIESVDYAEVKVP